MTTTLIIDDWWFGLPPDEEHIRELLQVVGFHEDPEARADLARYTDAFEMRAAVVTLPEHHAPKLEKLEQVLGDQLDPYRTQRPEVVKAVLYEAWRLTEKERPTPSQIERKASAALARVEAVLQREQALRLRAERAAGTAASEPPAQDHDYELSVRQREAAPQADDGPSVDNTPEGGVAEEASAPPTDEPVDRPPDEVPADRRERPVPAPVSVEPGGHAPGKAADDCDDRGGKHGQQSEPVVVPPPFELPDPCGGVFESARVEHMSSLAYVYPFEEYGLSAAIAELARRLTKREIDLRSDVSLQLLTYMEREDRRVPSSAQRREMMAGLLGPESGFPERMERFAEVSAEFLRARHKFLAGGPLETVARKAFDAQAEEVRCYLSAAGCGMPSLIACQVTEDAAAMLQILNHDRTACALGLGDCEASAYLAITTLTPKLERPAARDVRDRARYGRELILALVTLPKTDAAREAVAELVIAYHQAGCEGDALKEVRQLPAYTGHGDHAHEEANGSSPVLLTALTGGAG